MHLIAERASMIYYNREFYCIQIHDAELACDSLLFNNIFEIPKVQLSHLFFGKLSTF